MTKQILHLAKWLRRRFHRLGLAVFAAGTLGFGAVPAEAQGSVEPTQNEGRKLTLSEQLRVGLRARTKADFAFLDSVVALVEQGKLPRRLVDGTFLWARNRAARKSRSRELRPMVYFRPALVLRANRIGVKL